MGKRGGAGHKGKPCPADSKRSRGTTPTRSQPSSVVRERASRHTRRLATSKPGCGSSVQPATRSLAGLELTRRQTESRFEHEPRFPICPAQRFDVGHDPCDRHLVAWCRLLLDRQPPRGEDFVASPQFIGVRRAHTSIIHNRGFFVHSLLKSSAGREIRVRADGPARCGEANSPARKKWRAGGVSLKRGRALAEMGDHLGPPAAGAARPL
jgi:hypothetical protein